jgi:hypothetical protein
MCIGPSVFRMSNGPAKERAAGKGGRPSEQGAVGEGEQRGRSVGVGVDVGVGPDVEHEQGGNTNHQRSDGYQFTGGVWVGLLLLLCPPRNSLLSLLFRPMTLLAGMSGSHPTKRVLWINRGIRGREGGRECRVAAMTEEVQVAWRVPASVPASVPGARCQVRR